MKKYKAIRNFLHKGLAVEQGATVELETGEANFLLRTARVEEANEEAAPLDTMTKAALLDLAVSKGLAAKPTMTKAEILDLLSLEG